MRKSKIRIEFERLTDIINSAASDIEKLRAQCKHIRTEKKYGSNTGNYNPTENCYWTDFTCCACGKWWRVDGSK